MFFNETVLFDGESELTRYRVVDMVYEGRKARILFAGNRSSQSGIAADDNPELLFDYNQRFLEIVQSIRPANIILIGGGAFTLPQAILERFQTLTIDVVEIDPFLPELATNYFGLQANPRLHIFIQDGREYIEQTDKTYDLIILDAFSNYDIPQSLITKEAARYYATRLNKQGSMVINFIAEYHTFRQSLAHTLVATFQTAFSSIELYPADPYYPAKEEQNIILVASQQKLTNLDYLQSAAVQLLVEPVEAILLDGGHFSYDPEAH